MGVQLAYKAETEIVNTEPISLCIICNKADFYIACNVCECECVFFGGVDRPLGCSRYCEDVGTCALAAGAAPAENTAEIAFTAGEYEATAYGYNGNVTGKVTFSETKLENVEIVSSMETGHVGTDAFSIMIPEMIAANGSGVDGVSGATFSGRALREIVNGAAEQAGCTNLDAPTWMLSNPTRSSIPPANPLKRRRM